MQQELKLQRIIPNSIIWDPQPDISAFELAEAIRVILLLGTQWQQTAANMLSTMPPEIKRHFKLELAQ